MKEVHVNREKTRLDRQELERRESEVLKLYKESTRHDKHIFTQSTMRVALLEGAATGDEFIVRQMLTRGIDISTADDSHRTSLWLAAEMGQLDVVQLLLKMGANIETKSKDGITPLMAAVSEMGRNDVVQQLVAHGADLEAEDIEGRTPLVRAAAAGNVDAVRLLLQRGTGTDVHQQGGWKALLIALGKGFSDIVQVLRGNGAFTGLIEDDISPLKGAGYGERTIEQFLVQQGATVYSNNTMTKMPLLWAAWMGQERIISYLCDQGARVEAPGYDGKTPLAMAASEGHERCVKILLDRGANKNSVNIFGRTPLSLAVELGHLAVVQELMSRGASLSLRCKEGRYPEWYAQDGAARQKRGDPPPWGSSMWGKEHEDIALLLKQAAQEEL
jgi:ankyrin repeat protein